MLAIDKSFQLLILRMKNILTDHLIKTKNIEQYWQVAYKAKVETLRIQKVKNEQYQAVFSIFAK